MYYSLNLCILWPIQNSDRNEGCKHDTLRNSDTTVPLAVQYSRTLYNANQKCALDKIQQENTFNSVTQFYLYFPPVHWNPYST